MSVADGRQSASAAVKKWDRNNCFHGNQRSIPVTKIRLSLIMSTLEQKLTVPTKLSPLLEVQLPLEVPAAQH